VLEKNLTEFHDILHNQMQHQENYYQVYKIFFFKSRIKLKLISIYFIAASKYCLDSLTTSVAINIQPFKLKAYLKKQKINLKKTII
jgi:hypothetical protein